MKKIYTILTALFLLVTLWAQTPQKMSYQAVIRNSTNALVPNTQVGMQISILQGSSSGTVVYTETKAPMTNANGLVSVEIGGEAGFSAIDWANDIYFIKAETDPTGGTNYTITGTSQLLSVPYALNAKTAEAISGGIIETDPTYTNSQAANITLTDITNLGNLSGINTGDQDLSGLASKTALGDSTALVRSEIPDVSGFLTIEIDPAYTNSQAANITLTDITNLGNLSGINTGDQDLSGLASKTALGDSTALVRSEIPDVSGFLTIEIDPAYTNSHAANITLTDITNLGNLSGINTGDQDLSGLASKTALGDSTALVRSEIPDVSGFLTIETDPLFTAWDKSMGVSITESQISDLGAYLETETDPLFTAWDKSAGVSITESQISDLGTYLKTETDPLFTLWDKSAGVSITESQISDLGTYLETETDPLFTAWDKSAGVLITESQISDLGTYLETETDPLFTAWDKSTGVSITESQISDLGAYLETETDPLFTAWDKSAGVSITESQISDLGVYLETETDPLFTAWDKSTGVSITESQISDLGVYLETETDPLFTAWDKSAGVSITESQISDLGVYLETETDPLFTAWDKSTGVSITESQISDLGTYLETETDPLFTAWDKSAGVLITESQISDLGTYLETETDPLFTAWDKDYEDLTNKPTIPTAADGSETKVTAGINVSVTGTGTTGSPYVINSTLAFAEFYAMMPSDNAATVAPGAAIEFPQNGPSTGITRVSSAEFTLPDIGTYRVSWQVSIAEAGQLVLALDGIEVPRTTVGRAALTSQITGNSLITTTSVNSVLSVKNPTGNPVALTVTPSAGGTNPVSASLVIMRIQ